MQDQSPHGVIADILHFWFEELDPKDWWRKDASLDATVAARFGDVYRKLRDGVPETWLKTPEGFLAAILGAGSVSPQHLPR